MIGWLLVAAAGAVPLSAPFGSADYGSYYPTAYYDHYGVDWACGSIRYSGHRGSDFGVGSWSGMDAGRDIAAAADGTVIAANDGEYDRCSSGACGGGGGYGNYVAVRHADGMVTYYAHMKKWSVAVSYGQTVSCGQKLGEVGSSGYSTGPHLHFEPRSGSTRVDPFRGSCSSFGGSWISQGSHGGRPAISCGPADRDGDGYDETRDCNDGNSRIHPGATEICDNGVDEDCDGVDGNSRTWYIDGDGDGFGAESVSVCGSRPAGTVADGGDCDDSRASVSPAAEEVCDALDNDCDDEIDEGAPTEMGEERPLLAARLMDRSAPSVLAPGEAGEVWVLLENVGSQPWRRGALWLRPFDPAALSPLHDEAGWAAWDVLGALDADVPVGGTGVIRGSVRMSEAATGAVAERFVLADPSGATVRCPTGEVGVDVWIRAAAPSESAAPLTGGSAELPVGCSAAARASGATWLVGLLALGWRRRCAG